MSKNIYEIAQAIGNGDYFKSDIQEIIKIIKDFFENKYISAFQNEMQIQATSIKNNPSREIKLLRVLKEFTNESVHSEIENAISMLTTINAISKIYNNMTPIVATSIQEKYESEQSQDTMYQEELYQQKKYKQDDFIKDSSIKEDGIYDIDEGCLKAKENSINNSSNNNNDNILGIILILVLMML